MRNLPVCGNWTWVSNYFPMVRPGHLNCVWCTDSCTPRIATRTEPVILRRASCSTSQTVICGSVHCICQNFVSKYGIIRNTSCCQVMWNLFHDLQYPINIIITVFSDYLEWSKKLCTKQLSTFLSSKMLQWNINSSRSICTIDGWNCVILQWNTSP